MPSDLILGKRIKRTRGPLTRRQTGMQARKKIVGKYGEVKDRGMYYHRGRGEWTKYNPYTDLKRKSGKRRWTASRRHKTDRRRSRI